MSRTFNSSTITKILLCISAICCCANIAVAQDPEASPPVETPETDRQVQEPVLLRNTSDGSVQVLQGGKVINVYPPGSLTVSEPAERVLEQRQQREDAFREGQEHEAEAAAAAEQAQAEQTAQQQVAEADRARAAAKERAALRQRSVSVLNNTTGEYQKLVPMKAVGQTRGLDRQDLESRAVSVLDGNTGEYIQAIPVEMLADE